MQEPIKFVGQDKMANYFNESGSYCTDFNGETKPQIDICCHQINLQCWVVGQRKSTEATKQPRLLLLLQVALHKLMVGVNC